MTNIYETQLDNKDPNFHNVFKERRIMMGLTKEELAKKVDLDLTTIIRYEKAPNTFTSTGIKIRASRPSKRTLARLNEVLCCNISKVETYCRFKTVWQPVKPWPEGTVIISSHLRALNVKNET